MVFNDLILTGTSHSTRPGGSCSAWTLSELFGGSQSNSSLFARIPTLLVSCCLLSRQGTRRYSWVEGLLLCFVIWRMVCLIAPTYGTFVVSLLCGRQMSMIGAGGTVALHPNLPQGCSGFAAWHSELRAQRKEPLFCLGCGVW